MIGKYDLSGWVKGVAGLRKESLVPAGLCNTVLRVWCGTPVYVAVLRGEGAELGYEENPVIRHQSDHTRIKCLSGQSEWSGS